MSEMIPLLRFVYDRRCKATDVKPAAVDLEIYFNRRERKFIGTGVQVLPNQWCDTNCVVYHENAEQLNRILDALYQKIERIIIAMQVDKEEITLQSFTDRYEGRTKSLSFLDFMYDAIAKRQITEGTRRAHIAAWETVRRFGKIRNFTDLTIENIERFDRFLRQEDPTRSQVTIHGYHKRLKPYVIEAYKLQYIENNPYDRFDDVRGTSKEREPLTKAELEQLRTMELSGKLDRVRDLFIFSAYTGLAFADLCLFRFDLDVVENGGMYFISGERLKTKTKFYTPILPPAMAVLDKYLYDLPIISMQKYNDYLHVLEEKMGLRKPLTSHIARHTFATTVTLANDVPMESVSKMLGHKHLSTTQIYAKVLTSTIERQAEKLSKLF